jgi:hypothetical protein
MTMPQRGAARFRVPADRRVMLTARLPIYRQIGRRPSQVYVDEAMTPAASGSPERRLSDSVFWCTAAEVGDQIEERAGGLLLLTGETAWHPIQLSLPRPLQVASAFGHADAMMREDRKILEGLLAEGAVVEVSAQRSKAALSRVPDTLFAEDHPLVVTTPPRDLDEDQPASPEPRETDTRPAKKPPAPRQQ